MPKNSSVSFASEVDGGAITGATLPVERLRPAYSQVAEQLKGLIVRGEILPGQRLPVEADLATLFGVSRSTVREALRMLSSQSLMYTKRGVNGGTFVAEPSAEQLSDYLEATLGLLSGAEAVSVDELLEARELFEVPAARLAARRRDRAGVDMLKATLASSPDEVRLDHNFEGHKEFHLGIMELSGNRFLSVITRPVFSVLRTRFLRDQAPRRFWAQVADDHEAIVAAIEAGDEERSAELMHKHLERLRGTYRHIDARRPSIAKLDTDRRAGQSPRRRPTKSSAAASNS